MAEANKPRPGAAGGAEKRKRQLAWARLAISFSLVLIAAYYIAPGTLPQIPPILIALPVAALFLLAARLGLGCEMKNLSDGRFFALAGAIAVPLLIREAMLGLTPLAGGGALTAFLEAAGDLPFQAALSVPAGNCGAPYSMLFYLLAKAAGGTANAALGVLYGKFLFILFEILAAYFSKRIVARRAKRAWLPFAAFMSALFLPMGAINAAIFAQGDAVYAALLLGALLFTLERRSAQAVILFALAFAFAPPAFVFLPVMLALFFLHKLYWRDVWLLAAVPFVLFTPAFLCGQPVSALIAPYFYSPEGAFAHAPTLFSLLPGFPAAQTLGWLLALTFSLALAGYLFLRRDRLTEDAMLTATLLFALGLPFLFPDMEARYFCTAELFALIYAWKKRGRWGVFALVTLTLFISYSPLLYGLSTPVIPLPVLSAAILFALALVFRTLLRLVENQAPSIRRW